MNDTLLVFFAASSFQPSGVKTLGHRLKQEGGDKFLFVLLDSVEEQGGDCAALHIPFEDSHLPKKVGERVLRSVSENVREIVLFPNDSRSAYLAAYYIKIKFRFGGSAVRVSGIIHSNSSTSIKLAQSFYWLVDNYICVSEEIKRKFCDSFELEKTCKCLYPPIPISTRDFSIATREGAIQVVFVGRLVKDQKRFDIVLSLIRLLAVHDLTVDFHIAGDGPMSAELSKILCEIGASGNFKVTFHGLLNHEATLSLIETCDLITLTSDFEGCPYVIVEAMSRGVVPLVSYFGPETAEIMTHGMDGLVVDQNPESFLRAIREIVDSKINLERLKSGAYQRSRRFPSPRHWISYMESLLQFPGLVVPTSLPIELIDDRESRIAEVCAAIACGSRTLICGGGHIGRCIIDELLRCGHTQADLTVMDAALNRYVDKYRGISYMPPTEAFSQPYGVVVIASRYFASELIHDAFNEFYSSRETVEILCI